MVQKIRWTQTIICRSLSAIAATPSVSRPHLKRHENTIPAHNQCRTASLDGPVRRGYRQVSENDTRPRPPPSPPSYWRWRRFHRQTVKKLTNGMQNPNQIRKKMAIPCKIHNHAIGRGRGRYGRGIWPVRSRIDSSIAEYEKFAFRISFENQTIVLFSTMKTSW